MKKILLLLIGFTSVSFAAFGRTAAPASTFAKHSYELQVTPSADYFIYQKGNTLDNEPYKHKYPFAGFGFGVNYIFRPIKVVGVSTGLNFKMQGIFNRERFYPFQQPSYVSYKGSEHVMYLTVPIHLHLYKEMTNSTFEFAIGPEFNIPFFTRSAGKFFNAAGTEISSSKDSDRLTTSQMKDGAVFGLSVFLGGEVRLFDHGNLFIGPQIQFLNLVSFDKNLRDLEKTDRKNYLVSLGLKLGFRFHK